MRADTVQAAAPPAAARPAGTDTVHQLPTGAEAASHETLVDLANPGAYLVTPAAAGAAGSVVDLVKGHGLLLNPSEHPAERGYTAPPEEP